MEHAEGSCRVTEWADETVLPSVILLEKANTRRVGTQAAVSTTAAMAMASAVSVLTCIPRNSANGLAGGQPQRTRAISVGNDRCSQNYELPLP